jgi:hypothetical protein
MQWSLAAERWDHIHVSASLTNGARNFAYILLQAQLLD